MRCNARSGTHLPARLIERGTDWGFAKPVQDDYLGQCNMKGLAR